MNIRTVFLCIVTLVLRTQGLVQLRNSLAKSESPLLMKILQSIDSASSDEHLLEVTLKLLKSLCTCMRETLKAKEDKYISDSNLVDPKEDLSTDGKVLDLYKKIYNNTCFTLKEELTKRNNKSGEILNHPNCGKDYKSKQNSVSDNEDSLAVKNALKSKLNHILFKALVLTRHHHKYKLKRYNLYKKSKFKARNSMKHSLIVILTLHPKPKVTRKYNVVEEDLHELLHSNSTIEIDIIDTKHDTKEKGSEEFPKSENFTDCHLQSLYTHLTESEQKNLTKVFRFLRRRDTIKIYIEVITGQNHSDYMNICCENGTITQSCKKELIQNIDSDEDDMIQDKKLDRKISIERHNNYINTISKIEKLVKKLNDKALGTASNNLFINVSDVFYNNTYQKMNNSFISAPTEKHNNTGQQKLTTDGILSLDTETKDPLHLKDVSHAILILNEFVSKQTTNHYSTGTPYDTQTSQASIQGSPSTPSKERDILETQLDRNELFNKSFNKRTKNDFAEEHFTNMSIDTSTMRVTLKQIKHNLVTYNQISTTPQTKAKIEMRLVENITERESITKNTTAVTFDFPTADMNNDVLGSDFTTDVISTTTLKPVKEQIETMTTLGNKNQSYSVSLFRHIPILNQVPKADNTDKYTSDTENIYSLFNTTDISLKNFDNFNENVTYSKDIITTPPTKNNTDPRINGYYEQFDQKSNEILPTYTTTHIPKWTHINDLKKTVETITKELPKYTTYNNSDILSMTENSQLDNDVLQDLTGTMPDDDYASTSQKNITTNTITMKDAGVRPSIGKTNENAYNEFNDEFEVMESATQDYTKKTTSKTRQQYDTSPLDNNAYYTALLNEKITVTSKSNILKKIQSAETEHYYSKDNNIHELLSSSNPYILGSSTKHLSFKKTQVNKLNTSNALLNTSYDIELENISAVVPSIERSTSKTATLHEGGENQDIYANFTEQIIPLEIQHLKAGHIPAYLEYSSALLSDVNNNSIELDDDLNPTIMTNENYTNQMKPHEQVTINFINNSNEIKSHEDTESKDSMHLDIDASNIFLNSTTTYTPITISNKQTSIFTTDSLIYSKTYDTVSYNKMSTSHATDNFITDPPNKILTTVTTPKINSEPMSNTTKNIIDFPVRFTTTKNNDGQSPENPDPENPVTNTQHTNMATDVRNVSNPALNIINQIVFTSASAEDKNNQLSQNIEENNSKQSLSLEINPPLIDIATEELYFSTQSSLLDINDLDINLTTLEERNNKKSQKRETNGPPSNMATDEMSSSIQPSTSDISDFGIKLSTTKDKNMKQYENIETTELLIDLSTQSSNIDKIDFQIKAAIAKDINNNQLKNMETNNPIVNFASDIISDSQIKLTTANKNPQNIKTNNPLTNMTKAEKDTLVQKPILISTPQIKPTAAMDISTQNSNINKIDSEIKSIITKDKNNNELLSMETNNPITNSVWDITNIFSLTSSLDTSDSDMKTTTGNVKTIETNKTPINIATDVGNSSTQKSILYSTSRIDTVTAKDISTQSSTLSTVNSPINFTSFNNHINNQHQNTQTINNSININETLTTNLPLNMSDTQTTFTTYANKTNKQSQNIDTNEHFTKLVTNVTNTSTPSLSLKITDSQINLVTAKKTTKIPSQHTDPIKPLLNTATNTTDVLTLPLNNSDSQITLTTGKAKIHKKNQNNEKNKYDTNIVTDLTNTSITSSAFKVSELQIKHTTDKNEMNNQSQYTETIGPLTDTSINITGVLMANKTNEYLTNIVTDIIGTSTTSSTLKISDSQIKLATAKDKINNQSQHKEPIEALINPDIYKTNVLISPLNISDSQITLTIDKIYKQPQNMEIYLTNIVTDVPNTTTTSSTLKMSESQINVTSAKDKTNNRLQHMETIEPLTNTGTYKTDVLMSPLNISDSQILLTTEKNKIHKQSENIEENEYLTNIVTAVTNTSTTSPALKISDSPLKFTTAKDKINNQSQHREPIRPLKNTEAYIKDVLISPLNISDSQITLTTDKIYKQPQNMKANEPLTNIVTDVTNTATTSSTLKMSESKINVTIAKGEINNQSQHTEAIEPFTNTGTNKTDVPISPLNISDILVTLITDKDNIHKQSQNMQANKHLTNITNVTDTSITKINDSQIKVTTAKDKINNKSQHKSPHTEAIHPLTNTVTDIIDVLISPLNISESQDMKAYEQFTNVVSDVTSTSTTSLTLKMSDSQIKLITAKDKFNNQSQHSETIESLADTSRNITGILISPLNTSDSPILSTAKYQTQTIALNKPFTHIVTGVGDFFTPKSTIISTSQTKATTAKYNNNTQSQGVDPKILFTNMTTDGKYVSPPNSTFNVSHSQIKLTTVKSTNMKLSQNMTMKRPLTKMTTNSIDTLSLKSTRIDDYHTSTLKTKNNKEPRNLKTTKSFTSTAPDAIDILTKKFALDMTDYQIKFTTTKYSYNKKSDNVSTTEPLKNMVTDAINFSTPNSFLNLSDIEIKFTTNKSKSNVQSQKMETNKPIINTSIDTYAISIKGIARPDKNYQDPLATNIMKNKITNHSLTTPNPTKSKIFTDTSRMPYVDTNNHRTHNLDIYTTLNENNYVSVSKAHNLNITTPRSLVSTSSITTSNTGDTIESQNESQHLTTAALKLSLFAPFKSKISPNIDIDKKIWNKTTTLITPESSTENVTQITKLKIDTTLKCNSSTLNKTDSGSHDIKVVGKKYKPLKLSMNTIKDVLGYLLTSTTVHITGRNNFTKIKNMTMKSTASNYFSEYPQAFTLSDLNKIIVNTTLHQTELMATNMTEHLAPKSYSNDKSYYGQSTTEAMSIEPTESNLTFPYESMYSVEDTTPVEKSFFHNLSTMGTVLQNSTIIRNQSTTESDEELKFYTKYYIKHSTAINQTNILIDILDFEPTITPGKVTNKTNTTESYYNLAIKPITSIFSTDAMTSAPSMLTHGTLKTENIIINKITTNKPNDEDTKSKNIETYTNVTKSISALKLKNGYQTKSNIETHQQNMYEHYLTSTTKKINLNYTNSMKYVTKLSIKSKGKDATVLPAMNFGYIGVNSNDEIFNVSNNISSKPSSNFTKPVVIKNNYQTENSTNEIRSTKTSILWKETFTTKLPDTKIEINTPTTPKPIKVLSKSNIPLLDKITKEFDIPNQFPDKKDIFKPMSYFKSTPSNTQQNYTEKNVLNYKDFNDSSSYTIDSGLHSNIEPSRFNATFLNEKVKYMTQQDINKHNISDKVTPKLETMPDDTVTKISTEKYIKSTLTPKVNPTTESDYFQLSIRVGIETDKNGIQFTLLGVDQKPNNLSKVINSKFSETTHDTTLPNTPSNIYKNETKSDKKHHITKPDLVESGAIQHKNLTRRVYNKPKNNVIINNTLSDSMRTVKSQNKNYKTNHKNNSTLQSVKHILFNQSKNTIKKQNTELKRNNKYETKFNSKNASVNNNLTVIKVKNNVTKFDLKNESYSTLKVPEIPGELMLAKRKHKQIAIKPASLTNQFDMDNIKLLYQLHMEKLKGINDTSVAMDVNKPSATINSSMLNINENMQLNKQFTLSLDIDTNATFAMNKNNTNAPKRYGMYNKIKQTFNRTTQEQENSNLENDTDFDNSSSLFQAEDEQNQDSFSEDNEVYGEGGIANNFKINNTSSINKNVKLRSDLDLRPLKNNSKLPALIKYGEKVNKSEKLDEEENNSIYKEEYPPSTKEISKIKKPVKRINIVPSIQLARNNINIENNDDNLKTQEEILTKTSTTVFKKYNKPDKMQNRKKDKILKILKNNATLIQVLKNIVKDKNINTNKFNKTAIIKRLQAKIRKSNPSRKPHITNISKAHAVFKTITTSSICLSGKNVCGHHMTQKPIKRFKAVDPFKTFRRKLDDSNNTLDISSPESFDNVSHIITPSVKYQPTIAVTQYDDNNLSEFSQEKDIISKATSSQYKEDILSAHDIINQVFNFVTIKNAVEDNQASPQTITPSQTGTTLDLNYLWDAKLDKKIKNNNFTSSNKNLHQSKNNTTYQIPAPTFEQIGVRDKVTELIALTPILFNPIDSFTINPTVVETNTKPFVLKYEINQVEYPHSNKPVKTNLDSEKAVTVTEKVKKRYKNKKQYVTINITIPYIKITDITKKAKNSAPVTSITDVRTETEHILNNNIGDLRVKTNYLFNNSEVLRYNVTVDNTNPSFNKMNNNSKHTEEIIELLSVNSDKETTIKEMLKTIADVQNILPIPNIVNITLNDTNKTTPAHKDINSALNVTSGNEKRTVELNKNDLNASSISTITAINITTVSDSYDHFLDEIDLKLKHYYANPSLIIAPDFTNTSVENITIKKASTATIVDSNNVNDNSEITYNQYNSTINTTNKIIEPLHITPSTELKHDIEKPVINQTENTKYSFITYIDNFGVTTNSAVETENILRTVIASDSFEREISERPQKKLQNYSNNHQNNSDISNTLFFKPTTTNIKVNNVSSRYINTKTPIVNSKYFTKPTADSFLNENNFIGTTTQRYHTETLISSKIEPDEIETVGYENDYNHTGPIIYNENNILVNRKEMASIPKNANDNVEKNYILARISNNILSNANIQSSPALSQNTEPNTLRLQVYNLKTQLATTPTLPEKEFSSADIEGYKEINNSKKTENNIRTKPVTVNLIVKRSTFPVVMTSLNKQTKLVHEHKQENGTSGVPDKLFNESNKNTTFDQSGNLESIQGFVNSGTEPDLFGLEGLKLSTKPINDLNQNQESNNTFDTINPTEILTSKLVNNQTITSTVGNISEADSLKMEKNNLTEADFSMNTDITSNFFNVNYGQNLNPIYNDSLNIMDTNYVTPFSIHNSSRSLDTKELTEMRNIVSMAANKISRKVANLKNMRKTINIPNNKNIARAPKINLKVNSKIKRKLSVKSSSISNYPFLDTTTQKLYTLSKRNSKFSKNKTARVRNGKFTRNKAHVITTPIHAIKIVRSNKYDSKNKSNAKGSNNLSSFKQYSTDGIEHISNLQSDYISNKNARAVTTDDNNTLFNINTTPFSVNEFHENVTYPNTAELNQNISLNNIPIQDSRFEASKEKTDNYLSQDNVSISSIDIIKPEKHTTLPIVTVTETSTYATDTFSEVDIKYSESPFIDFTSYISKENNSNQINTKSNLVQKHKNDEPTYDAINNIVSQIQTEIKDNSQTTTTVVAVNKLQTNNTLLLTQPLETAANIYEVPEISTKYTNNINQTSNLNIDTNKSHYPKENVTLNGQKIQPSDMTNQLSTDNLNITTRSMDNPTTVTQLTDWWLDDMYLKVRLPLPINSNPGMVFPRRHFAKMEEVADLGALFIDDILDYKEMLDRGELPLERATSREKGQPLCMEQFYRLLGVCRIPEVGKDRLELPPPRTGTEEPEELVVVACRNYFYPIPVKAADRGRLTPGEIQAQLLHAMVDAAGAPPAPRIGLLTSMNRDQWARARENLIKDEMNRMNMELISRALCILCLDEAGGDRADTDPETNAMLRAMHGAGTRHHSANRWFDKTVQLIISSDGTIGMCYEHSAAEGVAVVRLAERALARAEVADRPAPPPALLPAPQAMKWNIVPEVQRTIEQAARDLDRAISDLDFKVYTYRGYGREFMKSCRTSPDVYIQLAIQYAYYKMYGYLVTTYESASLRRFRNGRVDNIRSAHGAALAWAAAMCTAETSPLNDGTDDGQKKVSFNLYGEQKKLELFEEAARKQTSIMEANILGKGIDNHLLGLREMARETMGDLPPVFCDDAYKQMFEFKMSTSQVATTTDGTFMGYGAVCPDGYGCCYNPKKDSVIFCISSFTSSSVTNTEAYRQSLEEALDSMKLMFQAKKVEN